jgi:hypothetical protein
MGNWLACVRGLASVRGLSQMGGLAGRMASGRCRVSTREPAGLRGRHGPWALALVGGGRHGCGRHGAVRLGARHLFGLCLGAWHLVAEWLRPGSSSLAGLGGFGVFGHLVNL